MTHVRRSSIHLVTPRRIGAVAALAVAAIIAACSSSVADPQPTGDALQLSPGTVHALDSSAQVIKSAIPTNPELKSLVDSVLLILTSGVSAKRVDVTTNLTTAPLYFVGVHRVFNRPTGSSSTWNIVGMDDPSHLTSVIEVSGFAQNSTGTAPTTVSSPFGNGTTNGLMLQVGASGAVTEWFGTTGNATFTSGASGVDCPGFTSTPNVTCSIELVRVHFTITATGGTGGAGPRSAVVASDVDVPTMQLNYRTP